MATRLEPAELWGAADYERIAERFAPVHDALIEALEVRAGERVLDVATGTGEVALRAARLGAEVTGLDLAPALLELARFKASREGLAIDWTDGNAQAMPYDDDSFDVVCSNFGIIFAPDAEATARELGRVCVSGGRLGLTTWKPNEGLHAIYSKLEEAGADPTEHWGRAERVRELLQDDFELRIEEGVWTLEGESPEDVWELTTSAAPPVKALVGRLDPDRLAEFRAAMLDHWTGFERDGRIAEPRGYLLVLGRRR
jgi:SAM-dependent methyltransferase